MVHDPYLRDGAGRVGHCEEQIGDDGSIIDPLVRCDTDSDPHNGGNHAWLDLAGAEPAVNEGQFIEADNPILAQIAINEGAIEFLDEPTGNVGMVAYGAMMPELVQLVDGDAATPLEVFLTLAPNQTTPERLLQHHRELAANGLATQTPRVLEMLRATHYGNHCGIWQGDSIWGVHWPSWLSVPDYGATWGQGSLWEENFYVSTGSSAKRALTICHSNGSNTTNMNLQTLVQPSWMIFYTRSNVPNDWGVAYRSSGFAVGRYRERAWTNNGDQNLFTWAASY